MVIYRGTCAYACASLPRSLCFSTVATPLVLSVTVTGLCRYVVEVCVHARHKMWRSCVNV